MCDCRDQVRQLVETLRCCAHEAFPVTPDVKRAFETAEAFDLQGIILRDAVLKLLQHHLGFLHADLAGELPSAKSHIPTTQKVGMKRQGQALTLPGILKECLQGFH